MNKKQYVLELLKKLEPHRDVITGVMAMVELGNCTDEDIDQIIKLIENHIGEIKGQDLRNLCKTNLQIPNCKLEII